MKSVNYIKVVWVITTRVTISPTNCVRRSEAGRSGEWGGLDGGRRGGRVISGGRRGGGGIGRRRGGGGVSGGEEVEGRRWRG